MSEAMHNRANERAHEWVQCRSGEPATAGQQDKMQLIREEKLAANLKALLRRWVEGDQTGFRVSISCNALLLLLAYDKLARFRVEELQCRTAQHRIARYITAQHVPFFTVLLQTPGDLRFLSVKQGV